MSTADRSQSGMPTREVIARAWAPVWVSVLAVLLGLACARPVAAPVRPPAPVVAQPTAQDEALALFRLFDSLGLADTRGRPYVRVWVAYTLDGAGRREEITRDGFLLAETEDTFTVQYLLAPVTHSRRISSGPELRFERLDLAAALREWIVMLRAKDFDHRIGFDLRRDLHAYGRLIAFVLAHAAWRNDLEAECEGLLAAARAAEHHRNAPTFTANIRGDLAESLMWEAMLAAGDSGLSRPALRERFAQVAARFPESEHAAKAAEIVAVLDRMIAEDAAFKPGAPAGEAEIPALIHGLREVRGVQWSQPGAASVLHGGGAAWALVRLGRAAIPALIAILDDTRLTRTMSYHRDFHYSHHIERYGDAAREILYAITGRVFADRATAEAWWSVARSMSEADLLALGMRSPEFDAGEQAKRLLKLDRKRGLRELAAALTTASPRARRELIRVLADDDRPGSLAVLREALRTGPPDGREEAARGLADRGVVDWVPELQAYVQRALRGGEPSTIQERRELVKVLVERGGAEGIDAASALYPGFDLVTRDMLLEEFDEVLHGDERTPRTREEVRAAEDALVAALADDATFAGESYWWPHKQGCASPRLNEYAARMLAAHSGLPFSCTWAPERRARAIVALYQQFAARRKLAPLVLPVAWVLNADATTKPSPTLVREVLLDEASHDSPEGAAFLGLVGAPLAVEDVIGLAKRVVKDQPRGHLSIHVHREAAGQGFTVRVRSVVAEAETTDGDHLSSVARLGDEYVYSSSMGGRWDRATKALQAVLAGPADRDSEFILDVLWRSPAQ